MRDFEVYWTAGARAAAAEPLYRPEDGHFQFKYLPAFAVAAIAIAPLPLPTAKLTWFLASVALVVLLIVLSIRLIPDRRRSAGLLAAVLLLAMGKFYGHELVLGQVNLLFATLAAGALLAISRNQLALAVALLVASVVVKPYGVLLLVWLVFTQPRAGWIAALGAALVLAAPVPLYGLDGTIALHRAWWVTVSTSTAPNLTNPDNVSVAAMIAKWLGEGTTLPATLISIGLLLVAAGVVVKGRTIDGREALEGALLLTLVPLLSPQGWDYVFLLATPAIGLIVNHDDRLPFGLRVITWMAIATIGLSIYDVLGRELYSRFMALSIITVCFFVVIGALATLRVRRIA